MEEKKFYNERLVEFENTINELRKYLQDKEDSFSLIVNRLRKYEDLNEAFIRDKVYQYKNDLQANNQQELFRKLAEERDHFKKLYQNTSPEIEKLSVLKSCLERKDTYEMFMESYSIFEKENVSHEEKEEKSKLLIEERTKNSTNSSTTPHINPNKELIKLLKKERLSNDILESALNEAIDQNEELIS